jgi:hypothetical protein
MAVARENVAIGSVLLAHGAEATTVSAGRWVLHPELAPISRFFSITVPIRPPKTTRGSPRLIGSHAHQNPSIAMRFVACSIVPERA